MLTLVVVGVVALAVSALTLFSGFGLGTLLLPAFALFFPIPVAVAATAVVHGLNNLFKLALLGRNVDRGLLLRFGLPAALAAFPGAWLLTALPTERWRAWSFAGREFEITPVGLVMGVLIVVFGLLELSPPRAVAAPARWLTLGGVLSGFFGGLSGHQGALRAAFLSPLRLEPARFAATQAAIACLVDFARLLVYGAGILGAHAGAVGTSGQWWPVTVATLCAFAGAWLGARFLHKATVGFVRVITGTLLLIVGAGLAAGLV